MSLKDDMARDIRETFLNEDDFAETRTVAGRKIVCVLYEDAGSAGVDGMNVSQSSYTLQAAAKDLPTLTVGDVLRIDGELWGIESFSIDYGMAVVKLTRNS
jgi:hypothetical protein